MNIRYLSLLIVSCFVSHFSICDGRNRVATQVQDQVETSSYAVHAKMEGIVKGVVLDAGSGEPLIGVHVRIVNSLRGAVSNADGKFAIDRVPAGQQVLEARMLGFSAFRTPLRIKANGEQVTIEVNLEEETVLLSEIVVRPEKHIISEAGFYGTQTLSPESVERAALYDEDIFRAAAKVPGLIANDFSSRFSIRGGEYDEVLVTFDGLELNDPFHLKDFGGGGMSILDTGVIGEVEVLTGAFPAEYGDRLSGVFQIRSKKPDQNKAALGLSLMNARAFSQGTFGNQNTQWMFSGRRGYLDFLLDLTNTYSSYTPRYFDVFGKITHKIDNNHSIALEGLLSEDRLDYQEVLDPNDKVHTNYGNGYLWVNLESVWNERLYAQTVVSRGTAWRGRNGIDLRRDNLVRFRANDDRAFQSFQVKQDWTFEASSGHLAKWGMSLKHLSSNYRYRNTRLVQGYLDPLTPRKIINQHIDETVDSDPTGLLFNVYTSHQVKLGDRFIGEAGGRFGYASWTEDRFIDPRLNLSYSFGDASALHAGWGIFHQPQGIDQLYVEDGDQKYYAAGRSRHLVVGFDHRKPGGFGFGIDLYDKYNTDVRPRYLSPAGEVTAFFPERDEDRVFWQPEKVNARGMELTLRKENGRRFNAWLNYTLSYANERVDGVTIPKRFDQRHTMLVDLEYKPWSRFRINVAWQYHTGWHYSDVDFDVTYQKNTDVLFDAHYIAINSQNFPDYHKLDLRLSQIFKIKRQTVVAFIDIRNLYNRKNVRLYRFEPAVQEDGSVTFQRKKESWLPRLPAFGLRWDISH